MAHIVTWITCFEICMRFYKWCWVHEFERLSVQWTEFVYQWYWIKAIFYLNQLVTIEKQKLFTMSWGYISSYMYAWILEKLKNRHWKWEVNLLTSHISQMKARCLCWSHMLWSDIIIISSPNHQEIRGLQGGYANSTFENSCGNESQSQFHQFSMYHRTWPIHNYGFKCSP